MLILLLVTTYMCHYADCRVYCQDLHALPFKYNGHACPVNCNNVIHAVETLKVMDVDNILTQDKLEKADTIPEILTKQANRTRDSTNSLYSVCDRLLRNKMALREVQTKLGEFSNICGITSIRVKRRICSRKNRDHEAELISYFTNLLNSYVHGEIKFTEDLTSLLLKRFVGRSELRQGMIDVEKLLYFLKQALLKHRVRGNTIKITLQSRNCLTIYVPGCYCLPGYVESEGQCVKPIDCFHDTQRTEYLPRVIVM